MFHMPPLISAACFALATAGSAASGATFGYDPVTTELPSGLDAAFAVAAGDDPIVSVTNGIAFFSMGGGDGYWLHNDAEFNSATGWTVDIRIQASSANTASQDFSVVVREPNKGQIQIAIKKASFKLTGEGAGTIGSEVAADFTDGFHTLRVTRLGNNVQAYLDDNDTSLVNATFSRTDNFGGNLLIFGKIASSTAGRYDVDFINVDVTQALQEAPGIPEPATAGLLAIGSVMTLLRRCRA